MTWLRNLWNYLRESWTMAGIYNAHVRAGSATPMLDANLEIHYRAFVFEAFRDEASAAYLHDGRDLIDCKKDFIKAHLGPRTTTYDRQTTALLRNIINEMKPEEAYHPAALERYNDEIAAYVAAVAAENERRHNGGRHPLVTRVLRGKA